jgi:hypothetical protein
MSLNQIHAMGQNYGGLKIDSAQRHFQLTLGDSQ